MDNRTSQRYEIVVRGELSDRFVDCFDGVDLKTREEHSVLTGVLDQSQLHGIFACVQDLGLELVSVAKILEDVQSLLSEEEVWKKEERDE
jgi:hypothetical protein